MVPRLIPGSDAEAQGRVEEYLTWEQEAWAESFGEGVAAAGT